MGTEDGIIRSASCDGRKCKVIIGAHVLPNRGSYALFWDFVDYMSSGTGSRLPIPILHIYASYPSDGGTGFVRCFFVLGEYSNTYLCPSYLCSTRLVLYKAK
jgi:hypothetical protein